MRVFKRSSSLFSKKMRFFIKYYLPFSIFCARKSLQNTCFEGIFCSRIIPYQERLGSYNLPVTSPHAASIIPYQERLGSYNLRRVLLRVQHIIPYQERLGSYNRRNAGQPGQSIIPYQERLGSYNQIYGWVTDSNDYTIPRTIRELQPYKSQQENVNKLYHTKND